MKDYVEFMIGLMNAPWDNDICSECGGSGMRPVHCCSGMECNCRGMPIDFVECNCGIERPSEEQIKEWFLINQPNRQ